MERAIDWDAAMTSCHSPSIGHPEGYQRARATGDEGRRRSNESENGP